jgi:hypothetical protein
VANWRDIGKILNVRTPDGSSYEVSGVLIRSMYDNLPNIEPGLEGRYNLMICRWRRDFWIPLNTTRGVVTGGGIKFFTVEEEKSLIELIQKLVFNQHLKLTNVKLLEVVTLFVGMTENHRHSNVIWKESWLSNFVHRHQGLGRLSLQFTPSSVPQFPVAILTVQGHSELQRIEKCANFQSVGSDENKSRFDYEFQKRKIKRKTVETDEKAFLQTERVETSDDDDVFRVKKRKVAKTKSSELQGISLSGEDTVLNNVMEVNFG